MHLQLGFQSPLCNDIVQVRAGILQHYFTVIDACRMFFWVWWKITFQTTKIAIPALSALQYLSAIPFPFMCLCAYVHASFAPMQWFLAALQLQNRMCSLSSFGPLWIQSVTIPVVVLLFLGLWMLACEFLCLLVAGLVCHQMLHRKLVWPCLHIWYLMLPRVVDGVWQPGHFHMQDSNCLSASYLAYGNI